MPPRRRHVFTSLASLHLHGDAKDAERRTCRFPDVVVKNFENFGQPNPLVGKTSEVCFSIQLRLSPNQDHYE